MKLKSCPFCGSDHEKAYGGFVTCGNMQCDMSGFAMPRKIWNARPQTGIQKLVKWVEFKDRDYSEIYKKIGELLEDE